ncbi:epithelial-stromal interaction protein 1 [Scomber scombrus]|uniref:epithelial-stromal interaction protein 1 n=1 Tax=Scomber scombrus TaxID=13677 RepID=UPI002DD87D3A|nr:epithelial-stromal interaction protein 1 [Scomber scombrus]
MDPFHNKRYQRPTDNRRSTAANPRDRIDRTDGTDGTSDMSGNDTPDNPNTNVPDSGNPQGTDRQPRYAGGFTMIPPNEARRSQITTMAQREEETYQRWRETNRVSSVQINPERLGGNVTLAEARERQFTGLRNAKVEKKVKKEEMDKMRRQEEEEKFQRVKAEQREKAERLEERKRQDDERRRAQFRQDQLRRTDNFLQSLERRTPAPVASSSATCTSSGSEAMKSKQEKPKKSGKEVEEDHRRVNYAFLAKLEGQRRGSENEPEWETERFNMASEEFKHQPSYAPGQQLPSTHLRPDPEQHGAEEADPQPDYEWDLMKLINNFPDCDSGFLEDILVQCNGDYQQAYIILISSLS